MKLTIEGLLIALCALILIGEIDRTMAARRPAPTPKARHTRTYLRQPQQRWVM